jgi:nucleotide-binding universal stress UspA family protein
MLPFRKILYPVDYSDACRAIAPYVREVARHFSAELTLIHAYALQPAFAVRTPEGAMVYDEVIAVDPAWPSEMRAEEEKRLRDYASTEFPDKPIELITEEGEPGSVIHRVIQHQGADLVMLPTHGRGAIRRFLLGSVTTKVLHDVSVPVWTGTAAALANHQVHVACKSILCAVDGGPESGVVLKAAAVLAESYGAELSIVRVVETPPNAPEFDFGPYRNQIMDAADQWVRELKGSMGIKASHAVLDAVIADGVHQEAVKRKADLVVVGRGHSQDTFNRFFSSLYPIVRESPCPVLSI